MTYGNPSVADVLAELKAQGVGKLLVIPLYPQYAGSSTSAALDKVFQELLLQRNQMSVRTVSRYYDDAAYIQAMKQHIEAYWAQNGRSEKLMLSFHGIPQKHHDDGDPYPDECHHTAKLRPNSTSSAPVSWPTASKPWKKSPLWDANNSTPPAAKNTVTSPASTIPPTGLPHLPN